MQIPGGVIMPDSSRIKALEKRVSALEAVVEKFTSTNSAMDAMRRLVGLWSQEGDLVDAVNETKRIVSEWNAAQHQ